MNAPQSFCPLCQRPNQCDATGAGGHCWCFSVQIPATLLDQLSEEQRNTACICRECIIAFAHNQDSAARDSSSTRSPIQLILDSWG
ncbi:cysteine-rich CWC family protein [Rariglobus hedericola]|uniref:Cysteine-rich CWC family protein n=1 Tax=Rariglobus hedericola TaxID=2597822 RepID=A0A556QME5_9BACT|nr:cysteine-rich CWC family protein [Rariglobus hedericola]TSJ77821.1 cysteine-rich CWC family protein [Rariglobus hedericola]